MSGGFFFCSVNELVSVNGNIISKCHLNVTQRKTKTATSLAVERFVLVEHTGLEPVCVCSPVVKMSVFCGLSRVCHSVCPSITDFLSPKLSPKVKSII